jgi:hypothetical protein
MSEAYPAGCAGVAIRFETKIKLRRTLRKPSSALAKGPSIYRAFPINVSG